MGSVRSTRTIIAALRSKGAEVRQSHHAMVTKRIDGVTFVVTRVSHGRKDVPKGVMRAIAGQCHLTLPQFVDLVDCPLSEADWDELILAARG